MAINKVLAVVEMAYEAAVPGRAGDEASFLRVRWGETVICHYFVGSCLAEAGIKQYRARGGGLLPLCLGWWPLDTVSQLDGRGGLLGVNCRPRGFESGWTRGDGGFLGLGKGCDLWDLGGEFDGLRTFG